MTPNQFIRTQAWLDNDAVLTAEFRRIELVEIAPYLWLAKPETDHVWNVNWSTVVAKRATWLIMQVPTFG